MTEDPPAGPDDAAPDGDPTVRSAWKLTLILAVVVGGGMALLQSDGRAGMAAALLGSALALTLGAVTLTVRSMAQAFKRADVPGRRLLHVLGMFTLAAFVMAMVAGIGG